MSIQSELRAAGRHLLTVAALVCVAGAWTGGIEAQSRERTLFVSATDRQGAPLDALQPADVRVREDGVAREVLRVSRATDPIQLAVLIDNSQAAQSHVLNLRTALKAFVARFPAPNEITLITYGDRPTVLTDYTSSAEVTARGIDRVFSQPGSGSYVLDAIHDAARGLQKRDPGRAAIVVVSTEGVEFSNRSYEPVLDALGAAGATLYVVSLNERGGAGTATATGVSAASRSDEIRNREILYDRGTRDTGGRHEIVLSSMSFEDTLKGLADELLKQFKVVYSRPTTLIPPEKVTVESARPDLTVRGVLGRAENEKTK